jgi:hypothetical protein
VLVYEALQSLAGVVDNAEGCSGVMATVPAWPAPGRADFRASERGSRAPGGIPGHILRPSVPLRWPLELLGGQLNKSLALLALPALLLTGCASGPAAAEPAPSAAAVTPMASPSVTPTRTPTPTVTKAATREEQVKKIYLEGIYEAEPALRAAGAGEDLISIGQGFCDMYDGGAKGSDQLHPHSCRVGLHREPARGSSRIRGGRLLSRTRRENGDVNAGC